MPEETVNVGRPTKLTPELQESIVLNLASGVYAVTACELAGIDESTFYKWRKCADAGEEPYFQFFQSVKKAEAQAEVRAATLVQKAMPNDWKACMTWLERKFPGRWGRKDKVEQKLTGDLNIWWAGIEQARAKENGDTDSNGDESDTS